MRNYNTEYKAGMSAPEWNSVSNTQPSSSARR